MTLEEARRLSQEITEKYGGEAHSDYCEKKKGDMTIVYLTLKFKIDKQGIDKK